MSATRLLLHALAQIANIMFFLRSIAILIQNYIYLGLYSSDISRKTFVKSFGTFYSLATSSAYQKLLSLNLYSSLTEAIFIRYNGHTIQQTLLNGSRDAKYPWSMLANNQMSSILNIGHYLLSAIKIINQYDIGKYVCLSVSSVCLLCKEILNMKISRYYFFYTSSYKILNVQITIPTLILHATLAYIFLEIMT